MADISTVTGTWKTNFKMYFMNWGTRLFSSVLDQGFFSGTTFIVNILLARWLLPEQYGAFSVAYALFLLLATFYTSFISEPALVFSTGEFKDNFQTYLGILIVNHFIFTGFITLLTCIATLILNNWIGEVLSQAIWGIAISLPFVLLLWLARACIYARSIPKKLFIISFIYFVLSVLGISFLYLINWLNNVTVFISMGVSSLISGLVILWRLSPDIKIKRTNIRYSTVVMKHWSYGKWTALSAVFYWIGGSIITFLVPIFLGLQANAAMAAVWNIFRPLSLFIQLSSLIVLPSLSRSLREDNSEKGWKENFRKFFFLFVGGVSIYGLFTCIFNREILYFLYQGKYSDYLVLVILFAVNTVASVTIQMFTLGLKSKGKVQHVSMIWIVSAVASLVTSIPFMLLWGLNGAVFSSLISYIVASFISWKLLGTK